MKRGQGRGQCVVRSDGKWQAHRTEDGLLSRLALSRPQPGLIIASMALTPGRGRPPFEYPNKFKILQIIWVLLNAI